MNDKELEDLANRDTGWKGLDARIQLAVRKLKPSKLYNWTLLILAALSALFGAIQVAPQIASLFQSSQPSSVGSNSQPPKSGSELPLQLPTKLPP